MVDTQLVIKLRKQTGAGMVDCQKAIDEANNDFEKAIVILRKKGGDKAAKRAGKEATEGIVYAYIHPNDKIGAMLELKSETDFVARNDDFKALAHDLALQIAAQSPEYISPEDVPAEEIEKEKEIYREQLKKEGKPEEIVDKIVEGKVKKFFEEVCLLKQPYIKDEALKVEDYINQAISKTGEKIEVRQFCRFQI